MVINKGRDTPVWIELGVLGVLVFVLVEVEEFGLVREFELVEYIGNLPVDTDVTQVGRCHYGRGEITIH